MASLYRRATPSQARILRAVEGAVKNVSDAHGLEFNPRHARSIAKRAAGTLSACWPEVLAATSPSKKAERAILLSRQPLAGPILGSPQTQVAKSARKARLSAFKDAAPLRKLQQRLWKMMRAVKNEGDESRINAFIEILRMADEIDKEKSRQTP